MKTILVFCLLVTTLSAFAVEQKVVEINSNVNPNVTEFFLELDEEGTVDGMRFVSKDPQGRIVDDVKVGVEEVIANGAVLFTQGNRDIVRLSVTAFDPATGGDIKIDYLYNGITGTRRFLRLVLARGVDGFALYHGDRGNVGRMRLLGNYSAVGLIGISRILINP